MLFHGATNLFLVSPDVASTGDLELPVLAMVAKWVLVAIVLLVAGPSLVRGPRPEARPRTSATSAPKVEVTHPYIRREEHFREGWWSFGSDVFLKEHVNLPYSPDCVKGVFSEVCVQHRE
jgi:hypothetical protein